MNRGLSICVMPRDSCSFRSLASTSSSTSNFNQHPLRHTINIQHQHNLQPSMRIRTTSSGGEWTGSPRAHTTMCTCMYMHGCIFPLSSPHGLCLACFLDSVRPKSHPSLSSPLLFSLLVFCVLFFFPRTRWGNSRSRRHTGVL